MKMNVISNITKTTAITNTKSTHGSKVGVDDINVNVNLPKINSKKNHLAAIDDDYEEDYDERVPQKPKNIRKTPTEDNNEFNLQNHSPNAKQNSR